MMARTVPLFRDDAYLAEARATVLRSDAAGIVLDRTVFYATSGGQPGDTGTFTRVDGSRIRIGGTVTGESKDDILHLLAPGQQLPESGEMLTIAIDWERRHRLMRMHTACHLLSVICPFPITGAAVGEDDARVDFDLPDTSYTRETVSARLNEMVAADHPIFTRLISEAELAANPSLVKSKNVRPPSGTSTVRVVCIGENAAIDSQPCGGTHVGSTGEIGAIHVGKIEKKGRENRRFRLRFGPMPQEGQR